MVAVTTTLRSSMGSRCVLPQLGVLLNNGIMWFDPRPGPNSMGPGRRPLIQHVPVILTGRGAAGAGGRRLGRPAHPGGGVADAWPSCGRFRDVPWRRRSVGRASTFPGRTFLAIGGWRPG